MGLARIHDSDFHTVTIAPMLSEWRGRGHRVLSVAGEVRVDSPDGGGAFGLALIKKRFAL